MKKLFVVFAVLLLLVACAPKEASYDREEGDSAKDTTKEDDKVTEDKSESADKKEEVGRTPPKRTPPSQKLEEKQKTEDVPEKKEEPKDELAGLDPQIKDLVSRADEKVKSYSFLYGGPETNFIFKDTYIIKGDKIKVQKYEEDYYVRANETTHVYLDTAEQTATGCCETRARCLTPNDDYTKAKYVFDFAELNAKLPKTPYQWLKEIPSTAKVKGSETFNTRSITVISYEKEDGSTVHMKLDDTYGLPHQVVITDGENEIGKYQFNDLNFNSWKDEDFVPPCNN